MIEDDDPLTSEILNECATKAFGEAAKKAMKVAGSVVTVRGDWVVRLYPDGSFKKLEKLGRSRYERQNDYP